MLYSTLIRSFIIVLALAGAASAQSSEGRREFCRSNGNWSGNESVTISELRETTVAPQGTITVDGKKNGGIAIRGENRADVLVRACVQATAGSDVDAQALAKSIRVETNGTIRAETPSGDRNWGVSFEILVPRNSNLNLTTHNGGISIDSVEGKLSFAAENGGVTLRNPAGDVKGSTRNGGVNVRLEGDTWKGSGLDVETTNGGVRVAMSPRYAARIETGTVNGGFSSDIPGLQREREANDNGGWRRNSSRIVRDLNGGGPQIRIVTVNGGVKIDDN